MLNPPAANSGIRATPSMGFPKVSIVLPTYNGSAYIEQSIRSCLEQTFEDFELIIVDDCSTDDTPQVIDRFAEADPRVLVVRHDRNRRLPGALNSGFAASRGRYLTWTSDDNLYRPSAIAEMVSVLEAEPKIGLVYAWFSYIGSDGQEKGPGYGGGPPETLTYRVPVGACFLYRREVYEAIGNYAEDMVLVEDWDYWIRVAGKFRLQELRRDLYQYRLHAESLSHQQQEKQLLASQKLLEHHLPQMNWVSFREKAHGYLRLARFAWRRGERADVLRNLSIAMHSAPRYTISVLAGSPFRRFRRNRTWRDPR